MFYFEKNKQKVLELIKQKNNSEVKITYKEISKQTGYSIMQLNRFSQKIVNIFKKYNISKKA